MITVFECVSQEFDDDMTMRGIRKGLTETVFARAELTAIKTQTDPSQHMYPITIVASYLYFVLISFKNSHN